MCSCIYCCLHKGNLESVYTYHILHDWTLKQPFLEFQNNFEFAKKVFALQDGLASVLRRTATWIMDNGGVVRNFENLGEQELPTKMRAHAESFKHGR